MSHLICMLANVNIDSTKTTPYEPAQFNPYSSTEASKKRVADQNGKAQEILFKEAEKAKWQVPDHPLKPDAGM